MQAASCRNSAAGANAQEESFVGSLFSDPSEIEIFEGLDDPLGASQVERSGYQSNS